LNLKVDKTTTVNSYALSSNITLTKTDIGLGNVDNTSDASKPVSTSQQTALNLKVNTSSVNAANGVAGLDASSKIAASQLPTIALSSLSDVTVSAPTNSQVLTYNGTAWTNAAAGGGSSSLAQNEIVIGVGETTTTPTTVMLRGPQGAGVSVAPGDVVVRAEGGTGSWGSGDIRFQSAAAQTPYPVFTTYYSNSATTTASDYLYIPPGFSNLLAVICVANRTNTITVSSVTLGAASFTAVNTATSAGVGRVSFYRLANPVTGTLTITFSAADTSASFLVLFENASTADNGVSTTIVHKLT
jgi:hypothetical protein